MSDKKIIGYLRMHQGDYRIPLYEGQEDIAEHLKKKSEERLQWLLEPNALLKKYEQKEPS